MISPRLLEEKAYLEKVKIRYEEYLRQQSLKSEAAQTAVMYASTKKLRFLQDMMDQTVNSTAKPLTMNSNSFKDIGFTQDQIDKTKETLEAMGLKDLTSVFDGLIKDNGKGTGNNSNKDLNKNANSNNGSSQDGGNGSNGGSGNSDEDKKIDPNQSPTGDDSSNKDDSSKDNPYWKECIPCWDRAWGDLKKLELQKKSTYTKFWENLKKKAIDFVKNYLMDIWNKLKNLLSNSEILNQICHLLSMLSFQCIPDIAAIIASLNFLLFSLSDSLAIGFKSLLFGLVSTLLSPIFFGISSFLSNLMGILIAPLDCIINSIKLQAAKLPGSIYDLEKVIPDISFQKSGNQDNPDFVQTKYTPPNISKVDSSNEAIQERTKYWNQFADPVQKAKQIDETIKQIEILQLDRENNITETFELDSKISILEQEIQQLTEEQEQNKKIDIFFGSKKSNQFEIHSPELKEKEEELEGLIELRKARSNKTANLNKLQGEQAEKLQERSRIYEQSKKAREDKANSLESLDEFYKTMVSFPINILDHIGESVHMAKDSIVKYVSDMEAKINDLIGSLKLEWDTNYKTTQAMQKLGRVIGICIAMLAFAVKFKDMFNECKKGITPDAFKIIADQNMAFFTTLSDIMFSKSFTELSEKAKENGKGKSNFTNTLVENTGLIIPGGAKVPINENTSIGKNNSDKLKKIFGKLDSDSQLLTPEELNGTDYNSNKNNDIINIGLELKTETGFPVQAVIFGTRGKIACSSPASSEMNAIHKMLAELQGIQK